MRFLLLAILPAWMACASAQVTSGHVNILDQRISWSRSAGVFEIQGVHSGSKIKLRHPNGKEKWHSVPPVEKIDGELWTAGELVRQVLANTESKTQIVGEVQNVQLDPIRLVPTNERSWRALEDIPIAVRAAIRGPLKKFVGDNYRELRRSAGPDPSQFVKCLTVGEGFREELFEPCLGLISPSIAVIADNLVNQPSPPEVRKKYFAYNDPKRPHWDKPALILVHLSEDFHYPAALKKSVENRIAKFHRSGNPVAFLMHNDGFKDASYFVKPVSGDFVQYTETGHHQLCENCPEITLAGGYMDWCLGLAARSYIANYFKHKSAGEIRINFAADSIYTEADSGKGSMGGVTALMEIRDKGIETFLDKRIFQYFWSNLGESTLADFDGEDKDGRFFPFLKENRFRFRVQVDGKDFLPPMGKSSLKRTIILNVVTK